MCLGYPFDIDTSAWLAFDIRISCPETEGEGGLSIQWNTERKKDGEVGTVRITTNAMR
jgi:hypothetical protein